MGIIHRDDCGGDCEDRQGDHEESTHLQSWDGAEWV